MGNERYVVILAAGKGSRMKSKRLKVLHDICGKPMLQHVIEQATAMHVERVVTVVGNGASQVREEIQYPSVEYVHQSEQLGTGHAVRQADTLLRGRQGSTVVLYGDTPLITQETLEDLLHHHEQSTAKATILTAVTNDPTGYGRVLRNEQGAVEQVVEEKDTSVEQAKVKEINTGMYCFDNDILFSSLDQVTNDNVQGEYYLPDVVGILKAAGEWVDAYQTPDIKETLGVNDRWQLSVAEQAMQQRINKFHMTNGVTIKDPTTTYIDAGVVIEEDTLLLPGTIIQGDTVIGADCQIGPHTTIVDSHVGSGSTVVQSQMSLSKTGQAVYIGPYAHIRPESDIGHRVKVGNFVEVKKASIGDRSKASHLSYVGDAEIGQDVNLGCGSITVNYDGQHKYLTQIADGAFIGCNANLIAPVTVEENAFVAAGSTITDDVGQASLAIARARQTTKPDYVHKLKGRDK